MNDPTRDKLWADVYVRVKMENKIACNPKHQADMAVRDYDARLASRPEAPAAPAQQASGLWQLVPIRPTPDMVKVGMKRMFDEKRYSAPWDDVIELMFIDMVRAAPQQSAGTKVVASVVEVCPECDIADCRHIRERRAALNAAKPGKTGGA